MGMTEVDRLVKESEAAMRTAVESVKKDFLTIRTGRAHPSLVENVKVDYYGTESVLKQLASITAPEARLLVIQPWDRNAISAVEKAILTSDIGVMPMNDGKVIRLTLPQLTQERREELKKVLHRVAEEGRISIRNARHHAIEEATHLEKDNLMTEDDKFLTKDRLQDLTNKYVKMIDETLAQKEDEISR